jgi:hypothetical protein
VFNGRLTIGSLFIKVKYWLIILIKIKNNIYIYYF